MERRFLYCIACLGLLLANGCKNNSQASQKSQISVNSYIDNFAEMLEDESTIQKIVVIQGNADTSEISKQEFYKDLDFYRKVDISERSYNGKYDVDTIRNNNKTTTIQYSANSKGLEVRNQTFEFNSEGILLSVSTIREFNSVVSDFVQKIEIYPDSLLRIDQNQDVTGRENQNLLIEHHLLKK